MTPFFVDHADDPVNGIFHLVNYALKQSVGHLFFSVSVNSKAIVNTILYSTTFFVVFQ